MGGILRHCPLGRGNGYQPRAHPQGGGGGQARGTALARPPAQNHRMAAAVLMPLGPQRRPGRQPDGRLIEPGFRLNFRQHSAWYANIDDPQLATQAPARIQQVACFWPKKGNGHCRLWGKAENLAAIALHAGRGIDGNDRQTAIHRRAQDRPCPARNGTGQAGTEDSVDHQRSAVQDVSIKRRNPAPPTPGHDRRIALQLGPLAQQRQPHPGAGFFQVPGDDKTIAAVVPRSAQDRCWLGAKAIQYRFRDGPASGLHQDLAANPGRHGRTVGGVHLLDRKQLHHCVATDRAVD